MARFHEDSDLRGLKDLVVTRKEATDIIALLVGQLADRPVQGNQLGACPEIILVDDKGITSRLVIVVATRE